MAITDPIADFVAEIKAAILRKKDVVDFPGSKLKLALAKVLKEEGFILNYDELSRGNKKILRIRLKYGKNEYGRPSFSAIKCIKKISKPGCKIYKRTASLHRKQSGFTTQIVSTSKGLMTDSQARIQKIGGELLLEVS